MKNSFVREKSQKIMKKVVVTGSNGFIAKNLSLFLNSNGFNCLGITRSPTPSSEIGWNELELGRTYGNYWIHTAGKAHDRGSNVDESEYSKANLYLTQRVFELFLSDPNSEKLIFLSSVKAVASSVEGILHENHQYEVGNPYGKTKKEAEDFLLAQKLPSNKKIIILRLCMTHGPGNKGNLNLLFNFVKRGIPYPFGSISNQRSLLSVDNLSFIVNSILSSESFNSGVYNVADDGFLSTKEIVTIMSEAIEKKPRILFISKKIVGLGHGLFEKMGLSSITTSMNKLTENYRVSNEKIKKELGITEMPISIDAGLKITIKSFL
jgi:nucleoside-diphosphate-sugar epimerase